MAESGQSGTAMTPNPYQASGVKRADGCIARRGVAVRDTTGEALWPSVCG
jgi:hypothetical protein